MELHKALRNIIQTNSTDILKDVRLINILDDINAYQDIPASKYILRAIIVDGFTNKLVSLEKWNYEAEQLSTKFSTITGFIPELVFRIFLSLAYGLGLIDDQEFSQYDSGTNSLSAYVSTQASSKNPFKPLTWKNDMTDDEKDQYLLSLIEYDDSKEKEYNVKFDNISFDVSDNEWVTIQGEILRIKKIPEEANPWLMFALYDHKGRMKETGSLHYITNEDASPKPVSELWYKLKASEISKIRLFWQD